MHYKLYKVGDTHNAPHRVRVSLFPAYAATNIFTSKLKNINHKACVRGAKEYILQGAAAAAHAIYTLDAAQRTKKKIVCERWREKKVVAHNIQK